MCFDGFSGPAAFTLAADATSDNAPEDNQNQEGDRVRGQDTAELFHFFKQAQAHSASVSSEVSSDTSHYTHSSSVRSHGLVQCQLA